MIPVHVKKSRTISQTGRTYYQGNLSVDYEVLVLDGVILKRKTGTGAQRRTMLAALGSKRMGTRRYLVFGVLRGRKAVARVETAGKRKSTDAQKRPPRLPA